MPDSWIVYEMVISTNGSGVLYEFLRRDSARGSGVVCKPAFQRDRAAVFTTSGGGAARDNALDYPVARTAAEEFYARLRELFERQSRSRPSGRIRQARR